MLLPPRAMALHDEEPVSRTYQYRKVMKPMLERKRRARINRCLDELKELMVAALQADGENVAKLEKADILELTVRHLHGLRRQGRLRPAPDGEAERFRAGFARCAAEVARFVADAEPAAGARLLQHLGHCIKVLDAPAPVGQPPVQSGQPSVPVARPVPLLPRPYAPPSPPHSPASEPDPAHSMWRPW